MKKKGLSLGQVNSTNPSSANHSVGDPGPSLEGKLSAPWEDHSIFPALGEVRKL